MKTRKKIMTIAIAALLVFLAGCGSGNQDSQGDDAAMGLGSFQTQDLYGNEVDQEIFQDYDLTMVNIWGTFCGPCLEELPYLGELQKEFEPKGINIVGIVVDVQDENLDVVDSQLDLAKQIAETTGAEYTHLLISQELMEGKLSQFDAIPATFFVDSEGNFVGTDYVGSRNKEDWTDIINETYKSIEK